jgi:hypothetical protein
MFSLSELCLTCTNAPLSKGDLARFERPGEPGGLGGENDGRGGIVLTVCALGRRCPAGMLIGVRVEKTGGATVVGGFEFGGGGRGMAGGRLRRSEVGVGAFILPERGTGAEFFLVRGEGGRISMTGPSDRA